jgi:hypothetical protein
MIRSRSRLTVYRRPLAGARARPTCDERGNALVLALMATLLMTTFGSALVLISATETRIAAGYRAGAEALAAADAALEVALADLGAADDWDAVLAGLVTSTFTDGAPGGLRTVGGTQIDLTEITNLLRCGRAAPACEDADIAAFTAERPWGPNNPRWQLYAWGPLSRLIPSARSDSDLYLAVWVADDQGENDGHPLRDGVVADNPGRGSISMIAHAYGGRSVRRVIEATVSRRGGPLRNVSWRERR